jgi:T5SS/PEP-CTERM-associated repeat protein
MSGKHAVGRRVSTFSSRLSLAVVLLGPATGPALRADTVIVQDTFDHAGDWKNVAGTTPDTANLPGSNWVSVVQWEWSQPTIPGSGLGWAYWAQNSVEMGEEKCAISIPLAGYHTGRLRISGDIALGNMSAEGVALGFKASVPGTNFLEHVDYDTVTKADFSGLSVNSEGKVSLVVNGVAQSGTASVGELALNQFYPFSYDVDTAGGDVFNIKFNGSYVPDFTATAFTSAATAYATFLVRAGARGFVDNFAVTAIEGVGAPAVDNASGATMVVGTSATLNGILTAGNSAHVYVYWGTDPDSWSHTNDLGTLPEGMFSTTVADLALSTVYYYRCFATNAVGAAWAAGTARFESAAQSFVWTRGGGNDNWNDADNWDPNSRFPNLPRETVSFVDAPATPTGTINLNQPRITVGGIAMTPAHWSDRGFNISGAAGQSLVFDYPDGPAYLNLLDYRWAGGTISAAVILNSDLSVSTFTSGDYALTFRGPITGSGKLVATTGRIGFDPLEDTTYSIGIRGTKNGGHVWKRGNKTATFTGTNSVVMAGDWGGSVTALVKDGGKLVISGGLFTNQSATTRGLLFGSAGNSLIVTNGGRLFNARSGNGAFFNADDNDVVVTGAGSRWDLHGDPVIMDAESGRLTIAAGGHVTAAQGQVGFNAAENSVLVDGSGSLWDVGGVIAVGQGNSATSNSLTIANGGVVQNTFLWLGGYTYYSESGGAWNSLAVSGGGKLYADRDDGWGWGSCIGVASDSGRCAQHNSALVTDADSIFDLRNRPLRIGYAASAGATGTANTVRIEAGGVLTNVSTLHVGCASGGGVSTGNDLTVGAGGTVSATTVNVGDAGSTGNTLTLAGGVLSATTLTLHATNAIAPVIGAGGVTPATVSGTATFAGDSRVLPVGLPGLAPGDYVILTAGGIVNNGLTLAPAANPSNWRLDVAPTSVTIRYRIPGTLLILH